MGARAPRAVRPRTCQTAPVWAAVKTYAEENNLKILWLVRTASQTAHIARETGCLPIYGRRTLCLHETVSQIDLRRFNRTCRAVRLSQKCPYWPGRPRPVGCSLSVSELKEVGERSATCPYELQIVVLPSTKAVVATHKQLPLLGWLLSRWGASREKTLLVIDEAQNIIKNALGMAKDSLSLRTLNRAAEEALKYGFKELAEDLRTATEKYGSAEEGEAEVEDLLPSLLDLIEAGEEVQMMKLKQNLAPASHLLSVADFKATLAGSKPFLVKEGPNVRLEALGDPREELEKIYEGWRAVITMSATIDAELIERLTEKQVTILRAGWPFEEDALRAYTLRGLTTRYPERNEQLYEDVAWIIKLLAGKGRLLVFLPSFPFLEEVRKRVGDIPITFERQGMSQEEVEEVAREFNASSSATLLAVFGGRLSEGIDLPADIVLLVGVPFAPPTPKNEKLLSLLGKIFPSDDAWIHGVILPALYSAVQRP